jgi:hypothetical protein
MLSLTVARILFRFSKGSGVMVESPTYYHSLSPVLRRLKEFDMENFPLQAEVIYAKPAQEFPGYLKDATFSASIICSSQTTGTAKETQRDKPGEVKDSSNISEASDRENPQDMKVNDCVSPGNNIDDFSEFDDFSDSVDHSSDKDSSNILDASERENLLEMKVNDCVSPGNNMDDFSEFEDSCDSVDDSSEFVEICDSTINAECCLRQTLTLKTENVKPVPEFCNLKNIGKRINNHFYINPSNIESALPDDKSVEQMDTDGILENKLHSKSSLKKEQSVKINKPANMGTFLVHPPSASTSSEAETGSEKNCERRINVKRFREIVNSLEASQRKAFIHALKNKLAVIQGQYVIMARY